MNKVSLLGRLCDNPEVRYTQAQTPLAIARYRLAVDKRFKKDGEPTADFIPCLAFGKLGELAEKYLKKGSKVAITGRLQTGSYKNNEGKTVYTWDVVVEEMDFCDSKTSDTQENKVTQFPTQTSSDGFMQLPDDLNEEELPFQ